jgi:polyribonucleotide nucleotidyltransferase
VEYREKAYAAGRIPGNFFRREGRPGEAEILAARQVDHAIRPIFPDGYNHDVQVIVTVLSTDLENVHDVLGVTGSCAALAISSVPFEATMAAVRVGHVEGEWIINPTYQELDASDMNIVVTGTATDVVAIEGEAHEVLESDLLHALEVGHEAIKQVCGLIEELRAQCGKPKQIFDAPEPDPELERAVEEIAAPRIRDANALSDKIAQYNALAAVPDEVIAALAERFPEQDAAIRKACDKVEKQIMRRLILDEGRRVDDRRPDEIRPITCEVGVLPRTHGSAIFTRGETQALTAATLGTKLDERMIDDLEGKQWKSFMLDYNFPPFCVGEVRMMRGTNRREIGHGALAERAIQPVVPTDEAFPYTIRVVSDILESNSSSSMATVCAGSLALMDAGVPVKTAVAGVGVGLITEGDHAVLLSDMAGIEDHLGDMDLKVAGTREGITAIQMDIKIGGLSIGILRDAFERALGGRLHVLDLMEEAIAGPRPELSPYAPRILSLNIKPSQIGLVIGPGGKMIREIQELTDSNISVEDDGRVTIYAIEAEKAEAAKRRIEELVVEAEIGKVYSGTVKRIEPYGAFLEILPGKEGMVHISELDLGRVERVEDILQMGQTDVPVKVVNIDEQGKIRLSRRQTLPGFQEDTSRGNDDREGQRRKRRPPRRRQPAS